MPASSRLTRAVAEVLVKGGVVLLHSGCGADVGISHCAVDHVKARLPLIQPQLVVGSAASWVVLCPPLDVEDAVGSSTTYRCEYAEPTVDQIQIVPVGEDGVVVGGPGQANIRKGGISGRELRIAVGRQIDRVEGLVVQRAREGQRDGGDRVIPVIADVGRAWHDAAGYLLYAAARPRRGCRRRS